jgi:hypothetical protein
MNHRLNKDGTPRKRSKDYLNSEELYYIHRHLEKGIPLERIAKACYCDIADVEEVEKRYKKRLATASAIAG